MQDGAKILVIDDEESMRDSCRQALSREGNAVETAEDGIKGLALLEKESFDLVILDLKMPGPSGMEVLKQIKQKDSEIVVVVITGYATVDSAVEAMKSGAYDFVPKPFTPDSLRVIVRRALEKRRLSLENILLRSELKDRLGRPIIIGQSAAMQKVGELVRQAAASDSSVLIFGEPGTGKELVARVIHSQSARKDKPFVAADCGSLPEGLLESELFGQAMVVSGGGAVTKYGRLEAAKGGTVFLDQAADMSMNTQAKLLRALQENQFRRVGSEQVVRSDVRVICGSGKDLAGCVEAGSFRRDLFYQLSVVGIPLPALRERKEDIEVLASYFLAKYNKEREKSVSGFSEPVMKLLTGYDWPGNVRELESVIERAVILARGGTIQPDDLWYYELAAGRP
jgi:DNA-binding NtrC family response regulator